MLYRCTFYFTEEKYKNTPPSNLFLKADTIEQAKLGSKLIFTKALVAEGIPQAKYNQEVTESSEEEVEAYRVSMINKSKSHRMVN